MKFKPGDEVRPIEYNEEKALCLSKKTWDEIRKDGGVVLASTDNDELVAVQSTNHPYGAIFYASCLEKIEENKDDPK